MDDAPCQRAQRQRDEGRSRSVMKDEAPPPLQPPQLRSSPLPSPLLGVLARASQQSVHSEVGDVMEVREWALGLMLRVVRARNSTQLLSPLALPLLRCMSFQPQLQAVHGADAEDGDVVSCCRLTLSPHAWRPLLRPLHAPCLPVRTQHPADSRYQAAGSRQQAAGSRQQLATRLQPGSGLAVVCQQLNFS
jgi:hypothetical protein